MNPINLGQEDAEPIFAVRHPILAGTGYVLSTVFFLAGIYGNHKILNWARLMKLSKRQRRKRV